MAANPISDSAMTRRPFLCIGRNGGLDIERQPHRTNALPSRPLDNVLHRLCPFRGGGRQQSLRAASRHVDHATLRMLQQLARQRVLLQQLTPATPEAHRRTQTLQLRTQSR